MSEIKVAVGSRALTVAHPVDDKARIAISIKNVILTVFFEWIMQIFIE